MPFFTYNQNNSGGVFIGTHHIIIEADTAAEANTIAERDTPIYFHGVNAEIDCDCCGDRWYDFWTDDKGDPEPSIWSTPVTEAPTVSGRDYTIYYANGDIRTGTQESK